MPDNHFRKGFVEKSRQRRSRHFSVLTYYAYASRVKMAAAFPSSGLRDKAGRTLREDSGHAILNRPRSR